MMPQEVSVSVKSEDFRVESSEKVTMSNLS